MSEEKTEKESFQTSDFYLAVYFKARGDRLQKMEAIPGSKKIIFIFDYKDQDLQVKKFYNRELTIEPVAYISAIRELKGIQRTI